MDESQQRREGKYIPPHLRQQQPRNNHFYTHHAATRQQQREISNDSVQQTFQNGEILESVASTTHINEDTKVIVGKKGRAIITVQKNMRNAKFNLLNASKKREEMLINKVAKNDNNAMCELAELYLEGSLGNREVNQAYNLLLRAANLGNSHAMCVLSGLHNDGSLGKIDHEQSVEWLEKAAAHNNNYANAIVGQRCLAKYLKSEEQDRKNDTNRALLEKSLRHLKAAASRGATRAIWQLAQIEENGWAGPISFKNAIILYSEAAKQGSPSSISRLQELVAENKFDKDEFEEILNTASSLIARTSSQLAVQIGLAQIKGELGNNPGRGFWMLEKAAEHNNEDAISRLAKCYRDGIGCTPHHARSQHWFSRLREINELAMAQGNIDAMLTLGNLHLKDSLGHIDLTAAEALFTKAANKNDIYTIFYLGSLYIKGRLGNRDPADGIMLVNKAIHLWTARALEGDREAGKSLVGLFLSKEL